MIVIFVLALLVFGPKKLPELGKNLAKALSEFRRASNELKSTWQREMDSIERESGSLKEAAQQLNEHVTSTYDDATVFNGALDRFDFKLVGKKEMYVPYGNYKLTYYAMPADVTKPGHINPDLVRWELHRVWVVEATLKPDKRHVYSKRVFYIDEDTWQALASDQYDGRGQLYRSGYSYPSYSYDVQAPFVDTQSFYDFSSGMYNITGLVSAKGVKYLSEMPADNFWSADALAGAGVR